MSGRSILHAMNMLVPPAWRSDKSMPQAVQDFYEYHRCFNEPWDGPAALCFTDGITVGAPCTGTGAFISSSKCAGSQDGISFMADWRPFKRVDIYAGVMISNVYGGLANGFTETYTYVVPTGGGKFFTATSTSAHTQNIDPTVGVRIRF